MYTGFKKLLKHKQVTDIFYTVYYVELNHFSANSVFLKNPS